jgi:hypothetical protein
LGDGRTLLYVHLLLITFVIKLTVSWSLNAWKSSALAVPKEVGAAGEEQGQAGDPRMVPHPEGNNLEYMELWREAFKTLSKERSLDRPASINIRFHSLLELLIERVPDKVAGQLVVCLATLFLGPLAIISFRDAFMQMGDDDVGIVLKADLQDEMIRTGVVSFDTRLDVVHFLGSCRKSELLKFMGRLLGEAQMEGEVIMSASCPFSVPGPCP